MLSRHQRIANNVFNADATANWTSDIVVLLRQHRLDLGYTSRHLVGRLKNYEGHTIINYPKYHCELNIVKKIWGYVEAKTKAMCDI
jgi:hypothetical protein